MSPRRVDLAVFWFAVSVSVPPSPVRYWERLPFQERTNDVLGNVLGAVGVPDDTEDANEVLAICGTRVSG